MNTAGPTAKSPFRPSNAPVIIGALIVIVIAVATGLVAKSSKSGTGTQGGVIRVVAAENVWGSIAAQLGGDRVSVRSIIDSPDADPHSYEPTAADSRAVADAQYMIVNGIGYDPWADKLLAAGRASATILRIGDLVAVAPGGNPHRWYSPDNVKQAADRITSDFKVLDPASAAYFDQRRAAYETGSLKQYNSLIKEIRSRYVGTPVGASESIFAPLAQSLGLKLLTPESFLTAMSEGSDPTAADKTAVDRQITGKQIKMYVYNSQNATPDVARQVNEARIAGIPVVSITETLTPAGASFQDWQTRQLQELRDALAKATGR